MVGTTLNCCGSNTVQCHTDHSPQCWSGVFLHLSKVLLLSLVFAYIYISQSRNAFIVRLVI